MMAGLPRNGFPVSLTRPKTGKCSKLHTSFQSTVVNKAIAPSLFLNRLELWRLDLQQSVRRFERANHLKIGSQCRWARQAASGLRELQVHLVRDDDYV